MNVLSLFDGISCGRVALDRAGVPVTNYFASEIDLGAMAISASNHGDDDVIQVGDVTKLNAGALPKIDLLIGGSPCQGFSSAGLRRGFDDPRSSLFWEFVRLHDELQPTYTILENVMMRGDWLSIIDDALPTLTRTAINSADFSAQTRKRMYWTNIRIAPHTPCCTLVRDILDDVGPVPDLTFPSRPMMVTEGIGVQFKRPDARRASCGAKFSIPCQKSYALLASRRPKVVDARGQLRYFTLYEVERLQTLPSAYLAGPWSDTAACRGAGNGWTVDVISHILAGILT